MSISPLNKKYSFPSVYASFVNSLSKSLAGLNLSSAFNGKTNIFLLSVKYCLISFCFSVSEWVINKAALFILSIVFFLLNPILLKLVKSLTNKYCGTSIFILQNESILRNTAAFCFFKIFGKL